MHIYWLPTVFLGLVFVERIETLGFDHAVNESGAGSRPDHTT